MTLLLHKHVILTGPEEHTDETGERSRNKEIQPCGCWSGEVFVQTTLGGEVLRERWERVARSCPTHAAAVAVTMLGMSKAANGTIPLGDGAQRLLARKAEVLAEARQLDAELKALTGREPVGVAGQLAGAVVMAAATGSELAGKLQELQLAAPVIDPRLLKEHEE